MKKDDDSHTGCRQRAACRCKSGAAGATLDAVQKKVLCNAGSVMDYPGSLMPMLTVSFQVLMLIFVVVLPLLYLVTTRK